MTQPLHGFHVRPPRPDEVPAIASWFSDSPLGTREVFFLAAFGQPGDVPLGAVIVRTARSGGLARFQIHVQPDCRRRKIGTTLVHRLYELALANHAQRLVMARLIHQDRPENAFFRSVGMTPERSFGSYSVTAIDLLRVVEPLVERFSRTHPHLAGAEVVPLTQINLPEAARFFAQEYGTYEDAQLRSLTQGRFDLRLSCAVLRNGRLLAGALVRSRPDQPYAKVDLIVAAPPFRHGPAAAALCAQMSRAALQHGFTGGVFEADERFDFFATSIGRRCNATAQWLRHRYAIDRTGIEQQISKA